MAHATSSTSTAEMHIHFRPGYWAYFTRRAKVVYLLLLGSPAPDTLVMFSITAYPVTLLPAAVRVGTKSCQPLLQVSDCGYLTPSSSARRPIVPAPEARPGLVVPFFLLPKSPRHCNTIFAPCLV